jgi:hypothetical protein
VEDLDPANLLNPSNHNNACFWSNVARDQNLKGIPNPATGQPYTVNDFVGRGIPRDVTTPGKLITATLDSLYGDANANGYGPTPPKNVSANRLRLQSMGHPTEMANQRAVEADLRNRGPGARSIVIVKLKPEFVPKDPTGKPIGPDGHVFTHEWHPLRGIHAIDALSGGDASGWYTKAQRIWGYAVK